LLPFLHRQPLDAPHSPLDPNAITIDSLRRTFNPISATTLYPDDPPDKDRCDTTETAHFSDIDEDDPSPPGNDSIPQIDREIPTNTTELHRESPHPSSPCDGNDEPPSMENDVVIQTQHDTTPQHNGTIHTTDHIWHIITRSSTTSAYSTTRRRTTISPPISHTSCQQQDH
jgi:hypothetical protein